MIICNSSFSHNLGLGYTGTKNIVLLGMGKTSNDQLSGKIISLDYVNHFQVLEIPPLPPRDNILIFHLNNSMIVCGGVGKNEESVDCLCFDNDHSSVWLTLDKHPRFHRKQASSEVLTYMNEMNETDHLKK